MDDNAQDNQLQNRCDSTHSSDLKAYPKWYSAEESFLSKLLKRSEGKTIRYEDYLITQLRLIYTQLEGDIRTLVPESATLVDKEEKIRVDRILNNITSRLADARRILENQEPTKNQLITASSFLNEIDERLVWILPPAQTLAKIPALSSKMAGLDLPNKDIYISMLAKCQELLDNSKNKNHIINKAETEHYRASLAECIRIINTKTLMDDINTGLQIKRLRTLLYWGSSLLALLILIFPVVTNPYNWPPYLNSTAKLVNDTIGTLSFVQPRIHVFGTWITALSFGIIGAIGGFLSGFLQVRESKTDLRIYEVSHLLLEIRPIFGAFAALISFILLSWNVLNDVIAKSEGSYILVAFVSGFSERYFVRLLKLNFEERTVDYKGIDTTEIPSKGSYRESNKG